MATILIAEDEPRIAMFMSKGLKKAGYQTHVVGDGTQALALSLSGKFDLVLLDVGLSGLDGWSVLSELRASSAQLPVIIITALYGLEERDHSLALGADGFISKPFRFNHLLKCIRRCI
ncbi:MAG: response regulator [Cyanobacteria bacterium P01_D01_bin.36]